MELLKNILYRLTAVIFGSRRMCLTGTIVIMATTSFAQVNDVRLPITLDADSTNYDGKTSMLMFEGLRLSQGNIGIQADAGRASKLDFEDSVWQFNGNVIIDTENGRIECETADLMFRQHELQLATIVGSPATFRLRRADSSDDTYAEAAQLLYNFKEGVVEFSGDAVITEGGNQISSNYLVYDILEQRINAQSAGEGDPRVKITYTPGVAEGENGSTPTDNSPDSSAEPSGEALPSTAPQEDSPPERGDTDE